MSEIGGAPAPGTGLWSLEWPRHGLPADLWALIAPDRACFMKTGHAAVCHGGIALEEVVVPFIHVRGRS